jgi:hypothetical protein
MYSSCDEYGSIRPYLLSALRDPVLSFVRCGFRSVYNMRATYGDVAKGHALPELTEPDKTAHRPMVLSKLLPLGYVTSKTSAHHQDHPNIIIVFIVPFLLLHSRHLHTMSTSHVTEDGETTTTITASTTLTLPAHPHKPSYAEMNPKSHPEEFAGVIGTTFMSFLCPFFAYFLFFGCTPSGCPPFDLTGWAGIAGRLSGSVWWDWKATWVYIGWYSFCVACWFVLPGERVEGNLLRDGTRNIYRMNGRCFP